MINMEIIEKDNTSLKLWNVQSLYGEGYSTVKKAFKEFLKPSTKRFQTFYKMGGEALKA